jgi:serine/threonine protein phosphatase PrpC
MEKSNLNVSSVGLAKGTSLLSEDSFDVKSFDNLTIAVLCDGVGSVKEAKKASSKTVKYLINSFRLKPESWTISKTLEESIKAINQTLYFESINEYGQPEFLTTLAVVVISENRIYGANLGDSRIYIVRDDEVSLLSNDHILNDGNRSYLSKAIGMSEKETPYIFENNLERNDYILLCSDGLYNELDNNEIVEKTPLMATSLVKYVDKKRFGNLIDDVSAVVVRILEKSKISSDDSSEELEILKDLRKGINIDGFYLKSPLDAKKRVWLVENMGDEYILKFPPLEAEISQKFLNLYVREVWNGKRIKSTIFPKVIVPGERTARYYLMEKIDGEPLNKVSVDRGIELLRTLLTASQYLLKFNLVHGDIKPDNIIDTGDDFKLVDFGSMTEIFSISNRAGTPSFLSPERFKGEPISEQSEIFAIGVTLYKTFTGIYPYGEIEPFQNPTFKIEPKLVSEINKAVPKWLDTVISKMVTASTENRYKHYSEILYDLKNHDNIAPLHNPHAPLLERDPIKFYKIAFWTMVAGNILQLIF